MTVEPGTFGTQRELNRLRVVDALRRAGTASRSELARMTGLSRTTVATLVSDLQARGLIVEMPDVRAEPSGRGRPPVMLRLDAAAGAALGVDFGHRRVRVAVADLSSTVLAERVVDIDVDSAPESALDAAAELADKVLSEAGIDRSRSYLTNAVKHFKFVQRGKRRIHQKPTAGEVRHYRWWLDKELALVHPRLIVALGATAALALVGKSVEAVTPTT